MNDLISTVQYKDFEFMFHYISDDPRVKNDDCYFLDPVIARPVFNERVADLVRYGAIPDRFIVKKEMRFRLRDRISRVYFKPVFIVSFLRESVISYMVQKKDKRDHFNRRFFSDEDIDYLKGIFANIGSKSERDAFNNYIDSTASKLLNLSEDELRGDIQ